MTPGTILLKDEHGNELYLATSHDGYTYETAALLISLPVIILDRAKKNTEMWFYHHCIEFYKGKSFDALRYWYEQTIPLQTCLVGLASWIISMDIFNKWYPLPHKGYQPDPPNVIVSVIEAGNATIEYNIEFPDIASESDDCVQRYLKKLNDLICRVNKRIKHKSSHVVLDYNGKNIAVTVKFDKIMIDLLHQECMKEAGINVS